VVLAALSLSLPFARNASPLSPAAVPAWFEALRSWFASLPEADMPDPRRFTMPPADGFLGDYNVSPGVLAASRFWDTFAHVFRAVAFVVAGVGVAAFLAWPVFSRRFRRQVQASRPGRRLIEYLLGMLSLGALVLHTISRLARRLVSGAWGGLGGGGRAAGPDGQAGNTGGAPAGAVGRAAAPETPPLRLRRQRHVVLRKLDEIAEAGTKKGAPFEPSQTTREYSRMLQLSYPGLAGALQTVVRTAEKALYSNHHLARGELRHFVEAARSVVRTLQDATTG
jgi:hypothetical protein